MKVKCLHCGTISEHRNDNKCCVCDCPEYEKVFNESFIIQPIDENKRGLDIYDITRKINEIIKYINDKNSEERLNYDY